MESVELAGRRVKRIGMSLAEHAMTGMWGEPARRDQAIAVVRRAVEVGVDLVEVAVPFGPSADLLRQARVGGVFVMVRLTSALVDLDAVRRRLGRDPDLVVAEPDRLDELAGWGVAIGVLSAPGVAVAAVRGPYPPAPPRIVEWCEGQGIPYIANSTRILTAGERTIALLSAGAIERAFDAGLTPPAAEPG